MHHYTYFASLPGAYRSHRSHKMEHAARRIDRHICGVQYERGTMPVILRVAGSCALMPIHLMFIESQSLPFVAPFNNHVTYITSIHIDHSRSNLTGHAPPDAFGPSNPGRLVG
jgi:hypothetical protein